MQYRKLGRTGLDVSVLSFGGSPLGGAFRKVEEADAIDTVLAALEGGINFFDVAPLYGDTTSEIILGRALKGVPRNKYIIATKVGQYSGGEFDFSPDRVRRSLDESCSRLGVDYIDLLQCHDIEFADLDQIVDETLPCLDRLRREGRIGHIGITGLPLKIFPAILERTSPGLVETILSFCRYTLNDTSLESLFGYLKQKEIGVINASPTGMGLLTPRGAPSWHPATAAMSKGARAAVDFCERRGADIVKLAVQFSVSNPAIATTLMGTADPANMKKNINYLYEPIDQELMAEVLEILKPIKNHNFTRGRLENRETVLA